MRTFHGLRRALVCLAISLVLMMMLLASTQPVSAVPNAPPQLFVDKNGDNAGGEACIDVTANDCSLRSAIQIAQAGGGYYEILFEGVSRTITLTTSLPTLAQNSTTITALPTQTVKIAGAGVVQNVFRISGSYVKINGLRLYGSGTGYSNIWISGSAQAVEIANNVIGDDDPGFLGSCGNSPNSHSGIYIDSTGTITPGNERAWIYGNYIKCNSGTPGDGVVIVATNRVVIGADSSGAAGSTQNNFIQLNLRNAVTIQSGASDNTVRNSYLQYGDGSGLVIDASSNNLAYGNHMQANSMNGVELRNGATFNRIGCPLSGPNNDPTVRNVIHVNYQNGIVITGTGTNANFVYCNWIGLNDAGTGASGNLQNGILVGGGAQSNIIGTTSAERNVISGNRGDGVRIVGSGTTNNLVSANYIGTNYSGTAAVSNTLNGVAILNSAALNTVGGGALTNLNLIAGNGLNGVLISGTNTATNTIIYNDIGYNRLGGNLAIPNRAGGIALQAGARANVIGDTGKQNYIAYNLGSGIYVSGSANRTSIRPNNIFSNTQYGVLLDGASTSFNAITRTVIHHNGLDGIGERNSASLNIWTEVSLYDNGGLGIDKDASSDSANTVSGAYPVITAVNSAAGVISGTASASALIQVYRVAPDVSGFGEGKTYIGSAVSDGSGNWSVSITPGPVGCYTAFETVGFIIYASSEFGPSTCRTFLPATLKN